MTEEEKQAKVKLEEAKEKLKKAEAVEKKKKTDKKPEVEDKPNLGGRPSLWVNPEVLKKLVDEFFKREKEPTLAGLAVSLNISRSTLYNYAEKDGFLDIIKKARERVEEVYERRLVYGSQPTGVIFALKNMSWRDKRDVDHTSKGESIGGFNYLIPSKKKKAKKNDIPDTKAKS